MGRGMHRTGSDITLSHPPDVAQAFRMAIDEATTFIGATAPNPPVGCTLLDEAGQTLVSAAHERAGEPHAEARALAIARHTGLIDRVRQVVVTLEPCNHTGRTPPCTDAILASPARSVWIGARAPNPRVAGRGADRLRAGGLAVVELAATDPATTAAAPAFAFLAAECAALIAPFSRWIRTGRPWVVAKQALDAHGSMVPPPGRKTFTSPASLRLAHGMRRQSDAILTGIGTILADAPEFTVRHLPDYPNRTRKLMVLDRQGRLPPAYRAAAETRGFTVMTAHVPEEALAALGAAGVLRVLVEAGPRVLASLTRAGLVDELVVIRAGAGAEMADDVTVTRLT